MKHEKGSNTLRMMLILIVIFAGAIFIYRTVQPGRNAGTSGARLSSSMASKYAPSFTLRTVRGGEFQSYQLIGKPFVLNFFTTWCPSCREEIPGFIDVYEKYNKSGFELIGIALDANTESLPGFIDTYKISYRILIGNMDMVRAYGNFRSVPTTFFIRKDGNINNVIPGYINRDVFEMEVQKLLE